VFGFIFFLLLPNVMFWRQTLWLLLFITVLPSSSFHSSHEYIAHGNHTTERAIKYKAAAQCCICRRRSLIPGGSCQKLGTNVRWT